MQRNKYCQSTVGEKELNRNNLEKAQILDLLDKTLNQLS